MFGIKGHLRISPFKIIIFSFMAAILVGTLLLCLPFASNGEHPGFLDALFTATSATCVTGLVVRDTWVGWTIFGKAVIILMIQVGGLGVVTIAMLITLLSGKKISLGQRTLLKEAISEERVGGILKLTSFILKFTLFVELAGAVCMFPVFYAKYGAGEGIAFSLFHSISAFCNAGFDLSGRQAEFSSLMGFAANPLMNITIMALILVGGLGFRTWSDLGTKKCKIGKCRLQTKVILFQTLVLVLIPALYFFIFEFASVPLGERLQLSFFQSVTTRTAGFNTADLAALTDTGKMVMIMLMLIGGAPGSTAGGMKTTTILVLVASTFAVFSSKSQASVFKRRIPTEVIRRAAALFLSYIFLFMFAAMIISQVEGLPLITCMFETASAVGTVGLTLGITTTLGTASKLILIFLMFFGRVGCMTLIFAAISFKAEGGAYPEEDIAIG